MSPLLSMSGVEKAFSGVAALAAASLEIVPGEVHALIGQNGAGKSTLIKILTGVYRRDQGNIWFDGRPSRISSPREAQEQGISTIYQELKPGPASQCHGERNDGLRAARLERVYPVGESAPAHTENPFALRDRCRRQGAARGLSDRDPAARGHSARYFA